MKLEFRDMIRRGEKAETEAVFLRERVRKASRLGVCTSVVAIDVGQTKLVACDFRRSVLGFMNFCH